LNFHHYPAPYVEVLLALSAWAVIENVLSGSWGEALLLLVWMHLGLVAARNIPIFAFIAAGPIARAIRSAANRLERSRTSTWFRNCVRQVFYLGKDYEPLERATRCYLPSLFGIVLIAFLLRFPAGSPRFNAQFDRRAFPVEAADILANRPLPRIFTFDQWGDYLIYCFFPKGKVFVDGRSDFYGDEFGKAWVNTISGHFYWRKTLSRFGIEAVLIRTSDPLASILKETPDWHSTFDNGRSILFVHIASHTPQVEEAKVSK